MVSSVIERSAGAVSGQPSQPYSQHAVRQAQAAESPRPGLVVGIARAADSLELEDDLQVLEPFAVLFLNLGHPLTGVGGFLLRLGSLFVDVLHLEKPTGQFRAHQPSGLADCLFQRDDSLVLGFDLLGQVVDGRAELLNGPVAGAELLGDPKVEWGILVDAVVSFVTPGEKKNDNEWGKLGSRAALQLVDRGDSREFRCPGAGKVSGPLAD
jgi:hypothetical protein